ncbi:MAG: hypothetical protein R2822_07640 [Spirosomataceae bacterium]
MNKLSTFIEEITNFLRPWGGEIAASGFPADSIYLKNRQLLVYCISLDNASHATSRADFLQLTQQQALKELKVVCLWEDVWRTKTAIVQSRLRAILGDSQRIPARLTQVSRIDKPTLDAFLEKNHLQVTTKAKFKYGLFLPKQYFRVLNEKNNELLHQEELLVAVASFSGGKNILRDSTIYRSFELIRFANLLDCTVVGGLDKLLKAFTKELNPDDIMTYADRDWSDGHSYERLGFERLESTPPQAFWINPLTYERHYATRLEEKESYQSLVMAYNSGSWRFLKRLR